MSLGFTGMANEVLQRSPSILRFSGGLTKMSCVGLRLGLDWFWDWGSALGMGDWLWGGRQALYYFWGIIMYFLGGWAFLLCVHVLLSKVIH